MKSAELDEKPIELFKPAFVLTNPEQINSSPADVNAVYAVCTTKNCFFSDNSGAFNVLFKTSISFFLYFDNAFCDNLSADQLLRFCERLTLLFFSKNYLYDTEHPVLLINENDTVFNPGVVNEINRFLLAQGLKELKLWKISERSLQEQLASNVHPLILYSAEPPTQQLINAFFSAGENIGATIIFKNDYLTEALQMYLNFQQACLTWLNKHAAYKELLNKHLEIITLFNSAKTSLKIVKEKLLNANSFVELAKTKYKDDYELLFNFYHKEYEILPLWYKRFGHIIKVIQGKRSFRSLFDDNVKKYKD